MTDSAAIINELFEEAIDRSLQFAQVADTAAEAAEGLIERTKALGDQVVQEAEETHGLLRDLAEKLRDSESSLEAAGGKAGTGLQTLENRTNEVRARVAALVSAVTARARELEMRATETSQEAEQHVNAARGGLDAGSARTEELHESLRERLDDTQTAMGDLQQAIAASGKAFEEARAAFFEAARDLETHARDRVQILLGAVSAATEAVTDALVECGDAVVAEHNTAMQAARSKIGEEAPQQAEVSLPLVKDAIEAVSTLCEQQEGSLDEQARAVLEKVQAALTLTESLGPRLDEARRLG
ncbi:MAG TPA: hypothetical protein VJU18_13055 [Vicinamibacteria bacterium]|nr:hypothetical protein [Vicinamibacteria bacterium]